VEREELTVTVLGSGTGIPSVDRCGPGYLLEAHRLVALVDCGPGVVRQLARAGRSLAALDAVFITHVHPDHVSDLVPLLHALILSRGARTRPLDLFGPPGFAEFVAQRVISVSGEPKGFELRVDEVDQELYYRDCAITTAPTVHVPDLASIAYRFEADARSVVFSGDSDTCHELEALASGADLLILDCSYPDELKAEGHLSSSECGRLAASAGARTVLLSHIYPTDVAATARVDECRAQFDGEVILAEDLLELNL
jgi:ribonuclease BN (tRNA processing enzyme)